MRCSVHQAALASPEYAVSNRCLIKILCKWSRFLVSNELTLNSRICHLNHTSIQSSLLSFILRPSQKTLFNVELFKY